MNPVLKISVFVSFFLVVQRFGYCQEVKAVDKSENTAILFDTENPLSLVGMLESKSSYWFSKVASGIAESDFQKLGITKENAQRRIGKPSTTPIIDNDPDSPNFGENLIVVDPVTGQQSFLYDAPDTIYYLLEGVNRIQFQLDSNTKVTQITVMIKKDKEDVPVLTMEGEDLLSLDGFSFTRDFSKKENDALKSLDSNAYLGTLNRSSILERFGLYFFPHYFKEPYVGFDVMLFHEESGVFWDYRFKDWSELPEADFIDSTLSCFDHTKAMVVEGTIPLIDEDPNSPNFGNVLYEIDSITGEKSLVYDPPWQVIEWIEFDPVFIAKETLLVDEGGELFSEIRRMFALVECDGRTSVVFLHLVGKNSTGYKKYQSILKYFADASYWREWQSEVYKCIENGTPHK
ncbi:MAG: hypothetical protein ACFHU9_16605 [Fluviicola sp.]